MDVVSVLTTPAGLVAGLRKTSWSWQVVTRRTGNCGRRTLPPGTTATAVPLSTLPQNAPVGGGPTGMATVASTSPTAASTAAAVIPRATMIKSPTPARFIRVQLIAIDLMVIDLQR